MKEFGTAGFRWHMPADRSPWSGLEAGCLQQDCHAMRKIMQANSFIAIFGFIYLIEVGLFLAWGQFLHY